VITSGPRAIATARLASAGLPRPATLITAEDVAAGKPEPDPYLLGARRLGKAPEKCAVFEDAPAGITAARAAGVTTVIGSDAGHTPSTSRSPLPTCVASDTTAPGSPSPDDAVLDTEHRLGMCGNEITQGLDRYVGE
jgi:beta-phosphoglucomutase-like phosphatase (HAD superfamily)